MNSEIYISVFFNFVRNLNTYIHACFVLFSFFFTCGPLPILQLLLEITHANHIYMALTAFGNLINRLPIKGS